FDSPPDGLVAISRSQASAHPNLPWTIIHNGLTLDRAPFEERPGDALCFVGRVDPVKGIVDAMEIASRSGRRLRIAAKVGTVAHEIDYYEHVFKPALKKAGRNVEYLGELGPADRDALFADSAATLMPGAWPEPFGLVCIESLACGTPVLARRVGGLPEIIREGVDGFFCDDVTAFQFYLEKVPTLDRLAIRNRVIDRFSADRMADRYQELYARMVDEHAIAASRAETATTASRSQYPDWRGSRVEPRSDSRADSRSDSRTDSRESRELRESRARRSQPDSRPTPA
ncbi:MAG: glycosyltransferase, partial [Chloroflexota bacterium]